MSIQEKLTKAIKQIQSNPRTCAICEKTETIHNVMLSYDNGKIMCDDCAFEYYSQEDQNNE